MSDGFDLDLRSAESQIPGEAGEGRVVLGVLDGSTPPEEWFEEVAAGNTLVLSVAGDLNELAADFAADVKDEGGTLMHFREFLVVTPPGVAIDRRRLD